MARKISAREAHSHFSELLREVSEHEISIAIEERGKVVAFVLPATEYERLQGAQVEAHWDRPLELARKSRERIRAESGNRSFPAPEDVIRQGREERDAQLTGLR